jgi:hypothetical protein
VWSRRWVVRLVWRLSFCSSILAVEVGAAEPARPEAGEPAPTPNELEIAKQLFREGNELRRAGDCQRALERYQRSRLIVASVPNTTNAAFCLSELGRYDEALELYEELTSRFAPELGDDDRASLAPVMSALRRRVANLEVSANTEGILVIDGRPRGRLPLIAPVRVLPGRHTLRVISEGWETFERVVTLRAEATLHVDARLRPLLHRGSLLVDSSEPTTVYIDDAPVGPAPWQGALPPGKHVYFVRGRDKGSAPAQAVVIEGRLVHVSALALPLGPELSVRAEPASAEVSIDGVALGTSRWQGRLPRGAHLFEAREAGYRTVRRRLDPAAQQAITLDLAVDTNHPRWWAHERRRLRAEGLVGIGFGSGLGSGAERACERHACPENDVALGMLGAVRFGYGLKGGLAIEASLGYLAFRSAVSRQVVDGFLPDGSAGEIRTDYLVRDELVLLGPFASLGASYAWALSKRLSMTLGLHLGGWVVSGSDDAGGRVSTPDDSRPLEIEGSGTPTRSLDAFALGDARLGTRIGSVWLSAGLAVTGFLLEGPEGAVGDVYATGGCSAEGVLGCAPGESFTRGERTHGPFFAIGPYASVAHDF